MTLLTVTYIGTHTSRSYTSRPYSDTEVFLLILHRSGHSLPPIATSNASLTELLTLELPRVKSVMKRYVAVAAMVATDVSHRCMRLKVCAIDKKLSFATPRVLIKKFVKLCDLQCISLSKKAFLRDSDLKSPSDLPRKSYVGSGVMIRIATVLLPLVGSTYKRAYCILTIWPRIYTIWLHVFSGNSSRRLSAELVEPWGRPLAC
jgi:hypothetical protein